MTVCVCVDAVSGINSASDLAHQDQYAYGTVEGSQTEMFFEHTRMEDYQTMWAHMSILSPGSIVKRVENGFEVSSALVGWLGKVGVGEGRRRGEGMVGFRRASFRER